MPQLKKSKLPTFKSVQEEAQFWDTHRFEEYAEELAEVEVEQGTEVRHLLMVPLDAETLDALVKVAEGQSVSDLAALWIKERLVQEERGTP